MDEGKREGNGTHRVVLAAAVKHVRVQLPGAGRVGVRAAEELILQGREGTDARGARIG